MGWTHDSERHQNGYDDPQMLERFIEIVEGQSKYNNERKMGAIPIIIWHNVEDNTIIDAHTTTTTKLFEAEIKYLHDNGFTVLTMDDLIYDERTNSLKIKEGINNSNTVPSVINRIDYSVEGDNGSEDNIEYQ